MSASVLIVDDDSAIRFTLQEILTENGYAFVPAQSGEEALDRLSEVDAIITDLVMPGMDGLELLRRARAIDSDLPVIVMTARGSERIAVEATKAGAYDYLPKPFDVDELMLGPMAEPWYSTRSPSSI